MLHLALIVTMLSWGVNAAIIKFLLVSVSPEILLFLRIFIGTFFLFIVFLYTKQYNKNKFTAEIFILGLIGGGLYIYLQLILYFIGIVDSLATDAVLIAALAPFLAIILERIFFKIKYKRDQLLGVIIAFCGVLIASVGNNSTNVSLLSNSIIFLSILISCLGGIVIKKMSSQHSSLSIVFILHLSGFVFFMLDTIFLRRFETSEILHISFFNWILILFFSICNGGIATVVWTKGIISLGVAKTTAYLPLVPFFGLIWGAWIFNEPLSIFHLIGLGSVFLGSMMATGVLWNLIYSVSLIYKN
jgi:drug/metabolite transporter (DMT)-like permease